VMSLDRCPLLLRVVQSPDGKWDALDQLADKPEDNEAIHLYWLASDVSSAFIDGADANGKRWGRYCNMAIYTPFPHPPPEEVMRVIDHWQLWCKVNESMIRNAWKAHMKGGAA